MRRRHYLTGVGATAAAGLLAGCTWPGREESRFPEDDLEKPTGDSLIADWDRVMITDYGGDPTGDEPVTPALDALVDAEGGNGVLAVFPEGTYRFESGFAYNRFEAFGLQGEEATIAVPETFAGAGLYENKVLSLGSSGSVAGSTVYVGGFDFDFSDAEDVAVAAVGSYASDRAVFEGLTIRDKPIEGDRMLELIALEGCRGRIHDCLVAGSPVSGIHAQPESNATVWVTDCTVRNCEDNGYYCSTGAGTVIIEGCHAADNEIANFRLGGIIRDSTVSVTDEDLEDSRGFWLREGDCLVEGCEGYNDADGSRPVFEIASSAGAVTVRYSHFRSDSDQLIGVVYDSAASPAGSVVFEDCLFDGEKNAAQSPDSVVVARDRTTLTNCSSALTGEVRPLVFSEADDCQLLGGEYEAGGPIWFASGTGGEVRDVVLEGISAEPQLQIDAIDVVVENVTGTVDSGVRTVVDGRSTNGETDPRVGGDWHENGRENVLVCWRDGDTGSQQVAVYRDGEWQSWDKTDMT